jgi:hypothetical protein
MTLKQAYDKIIEFIKNQNVKVDSFQVVNEVDKYRNYWKPERVNVILLAESHVFTSDDDFKIKINYSNFKELIPNYPDGFVRFVYCIGYSESDIFSNHPNSSFINPGTWQYWEIFSACASSDLNTVLKKEMPRHVERIKNKINLLKKLREMGIWLVDSSIAGINGLPNKLKREIIMLSWNNYVKNIVLDENPKAIIFIGKPVKDVLKDEIDSKSIKSFFQPQPQARLSLTEREKVLENYQNICSLYCQR